MTDWRDDHNFFENKKQYYSVGCTGSWKKYLSEPYHQINRSFRSMATATLPNASGEYYLPTNYTAFFFLGGSEKYEYWAKSRETATKRCYMGETATSQPCPGLETWGCNSNFPHQPAVPGKVISRAQQKVQAAINDGAWQLGQSLAELPEAFEFLVRGANTVLRAYIAVKSGKFALGAAILGIAKFSGKPKNWGQVWLAYQYGWRPLVNDVHSVAKTIEEGFQTDPPLSVRAIEHDADFGPPTLYTKYQGTRDLAGGSVIGRFERGVEVGVTCTLSNPSLYQLDAYGLLNPIHLAWELLPLSFVVDWFFNVGNFLQALTGHYGLRFNHGYQATWCKWSVRIPYRLTSYYQVEGDIPAVRAVLHSSHREVLIGFPMPVPYWDPKLNKSKVTSLFALIANCRK